MQAPDPIETILARLMPPALSQDAQFEIEAMLDELAGPEAGNVVRGPNRWVIGGGIAAAIAVLCAVFPMFHGSSDLRVAVNSPLENPSGLVLVSESNRIESMTDEGWQEISDGSAVRALRMSVVEENHMRDEETGMVVQISEPREEMLLMPITAF